MLLISIPTVAQPSQDLITLDEFMNATEVKALVKDGITEAAHLTIGGYSYGGLNAR
jgi:prolyl oligopeptidase PreP (S9A serine peptidase family)